MRTNHSLLLSKREDARSKRVARVADKQAFRAGSSASWKEAPGIDVEPPDLTQPVQSSRNAMHTALHW